MKDTMTTVVGDFNRIIHFDMNRHFLTLVVVRDQRVIKVVAAFGRTFQVRSLVYYSPIRESFDDVEGSGCEFCSEAKWNNIIHDPVEACFYKGLDACWQALESLWVKVFERVPTVAYKDLPSYSQYTLKAAWANGRLLVLTENGWMPVVNSGKIKPELIYTSY